MKLQVAPSVHGRPKSISHRKRPKVSDGGYVDDLVDKELGMQRGKPEFRP